MTKLRVMSDLHLEFSYFTVPSLPEDKDTILVLAGDIGIINKKKLQLEKYLSFLQECSDQFKDVILVLGNHEYWYGSIRETPVKVEEHLKELSLSNVHLLNDSHFEVPDQNLAILGTTLWTSGNNSSPFSQLDWTLMRDSRVIRHGSPHQPFQRKFSVQDLAVQHSYGKHFLREETKKQQEKGNRVVWVTHHAPSQKSIPNRFKGNNLSCFFATPEMEYEILNSSPELCIHGHIHDSFDYLVQGDDGPSSRVICNPRGYEGHEINEEFDSVLLLDF